MSVGNVQRIEKKYSASVKASGIAMPESVHCHMFRRTRATNLYQDGVAIELVSTVMGHAKTETTKSYYAKPSIEQLRNAMESVPAPIKKEELYRWRYRSERELKERIKDYVDFYNNIRPHEKLRYRTPVQVEEEYFNTL